MARILQVDRVTVTYRVREAVEDVSAEFRTGATTLIGRNGAGKSSLLRAIAGLQPVASGLIRLGEYTTRDPAWHRAVGYLPQEPDLAGGVSTADTVALAAWLKGVGRKQLSAAVSHTLALVGLTDRAADRARALSGGMRRRLALATALVHQPAVLLLDEPTAGLDPEQRTAIGDVIRSVARDRIVLLSTHVLDDLRRVEGMVATMFDGRIAFHGPLSDLVRAASTRIGRSLDPTDPGDLDAAYLSMQKATTP